MGTELIAANRQPRVVPACLLLLVQEVDANLSLPLSADGDRALLDYFGDKPRFGFRPVPFEAVAHAALHHGIGCGVGRMYTTKVG